MKIDARWMNGMRFEATNGDGLHVVMDAHSEHGGTAGGPAPMETLLIALAGSTGMDVIPILRKTRTAIPAHTS